MGAFDETTADADRAFVDLFADAGGLSVGFEQAGWHAVYAVETDGDAAHTYRAWHSRADRVAPEPKVAETPVEFTIDALARYRGRAALVVGGPPCQPWSLGGLRRGHEDPRDGLGGFRDALRVVEPDAFVMENVAGLTRGETKGAFEAFVGELADLGGWEVDYRVLQAADYGVPQKRERVFVVGAEPKGEPNPSIVTYAKAPSLRPNPYHGQLYNGGALPPPRAQRPPAQHAPATVRRGVGHKTAARARRTRSAGQTRALILREEPPLRPRGHQPEPCRRRSAPTCPAS